MNMKKYTLLTCIILSSLFARSQSLKAMLERARSDYPLYKLKQSEIQAQEDRVAYARSSAMPEVIASYQVNLATYNNITGMAAGQFMPISGPPSVTNVYDAVFGSAGSINFNWEPFTFGKRKALVKSSGAYLESQKAEAGQELFQHEIKIIQAYLDAAMAREMILVYSNNLERAEENRRVVRSLTVNGLRPGADTILMDAELSRARIELLNFNNEHELQQARLSELTGAGIGSIIPDSSFCHALPVQPADSAVHEHPLLAFYASRVKANQSERTMLQRTLLPRISLWGTLYARGSGIRYDGYVNSEEGLSFSRYNYGAGLLLSLPVLDFTRVQHLLNTRNSLIQAETERLNLARLQVGKQRESADIIFENSLQVTSESPILYRSAEFAYRTQLTRYNSGIINYTDLVLSQYSLLKAEADMKRSFLEAWKALLYKSIALGDLSLFIEQIPD
jgi:outer membrane protein TolC